MTFASTYGLQEFGSETSLSLSSGFQAGSGLVALGGGISAVFYYDLAASEIAARLVAADGTVGARVVASSGSIDTQNSPSGHLAPVSVAKLTNGNIVLTWASNEPTKSIYFRIFDASLNPLTAATLAETATTTGIRPDVAALAGGGFVIVWEKQFSATDSDPTYIRFDAGGTALDPTIGIAIDGSNATIDESPSVAGLVDGGFAIGWDRRDSATGNTTTALAVRNADGTVRVASRLEDNFGNINRDVDLVARNDGGFSIYYEDSGWGAGNAITGVNFSAAGVFQNLVQASQLGSSDAAAAVSSEGFVMLTDTTGYANFPNILGSILAPNGSLLTSNILLAGASDTEQVSSLAWLDAATLRIAYKGYGVGLGDDGNSVNSRTFHLIRTTTGDAANDIIDFGASAVWNIVHGGDGDDTITGGPGNDFLYGDNNNDTIFGGAGVDVVNGGNGINLLDGGAGDDLLEVVASGSSINGGDGLDRLSALASVSVAALSNIERVSAVGGATLTLTGAQFATGLAVNSVLSGFGTIQVNLSLGSQQMLARAMSVLPGFNPLFLVNGSTGADVIKVNAATASTINGDAGNDRLNGGDLVDTINGGADIDKIRGDGGADMLTGGSGADVFKYRAATDSTLANPDTITDFLAGTDKLNFVRIDADALTAGDQAFTFINTAAFTNTGLGQIRWVDLGADLRVEVDVDGNGVADMHILLQGAGAQVLSAADFVL